MRPRSPQNSIERGGSAGALALVLALTACTHQGIRPDGARGPLAVGAPAPEVVGRDVDGKEVRLSAQRGHASVVYFYPKDATPGCTKEACAFRDAWKQLGDAHLTVLGVSKDSEKSHHDFLVDKKLPFALVSDESGAVAASYGVGKGIFGYERVTFLIDGEGRIARYWPDVDPAVHVKDVLAAAQALPAAPAAPAPAEPSR